MHRWLLLAGILMVALTGGCGGSGEPSGSSSSTKPRTATFGGPDSGRPVSPAVPGGAMRGPATTVK
jgi:hypothetical protein